MPVKSVWIGSTQSAEIPPSGGKSHFDQFTDQFIMSTLEIRPLRLLVLFGSVFLITAYMPHPQLEKSLPESIKSLVHLGSAN